VKLHVRDEHDGGVSSHDVRTIGSSESDPGYLASELFRNLTGPRGSTGSHPGDRASAADVVRAPTRRPGSRL